MFLFVAQFERINLDWAFELIPIHQTRAFSRLSFTLQGTTTDSACVRHSESGCPFHNQRQGPSPASVRCRSRDSSTMAYSHIKPCRPPPPTPQDFGAPFFLPHGWLGLWGVVQWKAPGASSALGYSHLQVTWVDGDWATDIFRRTVVRINWGDRVNVPNTVSVT